jgi:hypothetical protein
VLTAALCSSLAAVGLGKSPLSSQQSQGAFATPLVISCHHFVLVFAVSALFRTVIEYQKRPSCTHTYGAFHTGSD